MRERRSMTALPPTYYLHVWWARRPLVASRAAILASLLPADADQDKFTHLLGIHGDALAAKQLIQRAQRTGVRVEDPYGYERAFKYLPSEVEHDWFRENLAALRLDAPILLDPTAGGGSIPFESVRLGLTTFGNDLNPVATLIQRATLEWPTLFGTEVKLQFEGIAKLWRERMEKAISAFFPQRNAPKQFDTAYLWARIITCPYCNGTVPLSPNWRLAPDGTGVKLTPYTSSGPNTPGRHVTFEIVHKAKDHSTGTVSGGDATCCYDDCARLIDGENIKRQAQAGHMGEVMYAVVIKRRVEVGRTKSGKIKEKWLRDFREPQSADDITDVVSAKLNERLPEWEALNIVPIEEITDLSNYERGHRMYGMYYWLDMFAPRQKLGHLSGVVVFHELLNEFGEIGKLSDVQRAAFGYLAVFIDKMVNYSARSTRWDGSTGRVRSVFDSHNFAMVWSYAEMAPLIEGLGYDWGINQTAKCIKELVELTRGEKAQARDLVAQMGANKSSRFVPPHQLDPIRVTTDPDFYQDNPESTEFWTPGNPLFPVAPDDIES